MHTCPLDFRVMIPPWKQNKEATEYNGQACEQHRTIPDPERSKSSSLLTEYIEAEIYFLSYPHMHEGNTFERPLLQLETPIWIQIQWRR